MRSWSSFSLSPFGIAGELNTWEQLLALSQQLNTLTGVTDSSFSSAASAIENSSFHVWGVATDAANAEAWSGVGAVGGQTSLTQPAFIYNSSSNTLSTGNSLKVMTGGGSRDALPWMAAALFDDSYVGMMVWSFRNRLVNSSGVDIGGRDVTTLASVFYPVLSGLQFHSIIPTAIDGDGRIVATDTSGVSGYNYSAGTSAGSGGYYSTSSFSADDGFWAFSIGDQVEGDSGPTYKNATGFGFGNFNSGDASSDLYWNGALVSSSGYVGLLFCDDLT